jgi:hypothetical protein
MKLLHVTFQFQFQEEIEAILMDNDIQHFVTLPMMEGRDETGRHEGSQVFPGNLTVIQAQIPDDMVNHVLNDLQSFRGEKDSQRHIQAMVLPVEKSL